ncbi:MAG: amidohydrolase family protein [Salinivirgaceae bacterium]|jgi:predicted TIM-barrel fold metal-dependent hydrolase/pimeloyl-ACP methyl ester carboxylesterase|nr:amidohydrolase family protein [Salinivirgaceae bacterium]
MRKVIFDVDAFMASQEGKKFVLLGAEEAITKQYVEQNVIPKITGKQREPVPGFWGTLGYANDEAIDWRGHIEISSHGNDHFEGVVKEEVDLIRECHPHLQSNPKSIKERFISFEHVEIDMPEVFYLDQLPTLRLELMLNPDEGALVFYQSEKEGVEDNAIEYIQPQATQGFYTSNRDRLKYFFDVVPQHELEEVENVPGMYRLSTTKDPKPFIVKIITFKRLALNNKLRKYEDYERKNSKDILAEVERELSKNKFKKLLANDHELLIFDSQKNDFSKVKPGSINENLKTLFLIHGTFSSTAASYKELYGNGKTWLKDMMGDAGSGKYEQILAFDHPTFFYGAEENIAVMLQMLDSLGVAQFKIEVDFMGTSQGGLLVQYLANLNNQKIKVGRAALVASANGVGYLTAGEHVAKFLSILKYLFKFTGMEAQALIAALAQHSAEFILEQPGLQVMTPDNPKLESIMFTPPVHKNTLYLPVIDDYDESLIEDQRKIRRFIKKMGARIVDKIATSMLGQDNDWVVGTKNQYKVPADYCTIPNYHPAKYKDEMIPAIHGTCLGKPDAISKLDNFFLKPRPKQAPFVLNPDYFDAHCHIFGREVISARIMYLLIQELLTYQKESKKKIEIPPVEELALYVNQESGNKTASVAGNIIKYFAMNKNAYQMLEDLENEYEKIKSNVYRYIPLMFDLEMTFRNKYYEHDVNKNLVEINNKFKTELKNYNKKIEEWIDRLDKGEQVFNGTRVQNEQSLKVLKIIKMSLKALKVADIDVSRDTLTGYNKQLKELKGLKVQYGDSIFPFIAVDPRRKNMSKLIADNVGANKPFGGIKMYAPNGYSPTDPHLCDDTSKFIGGKSLYAYCVDNNIPIMAHCSNAGFATFTMEIEVCGHIQEKDQIVHYSEPTGIVFNNNIIKGGFENAVRERAYVLNHPKIWRKALEKHTDLKICFAHFGGESEEWREEIAKLMRDYPNVYTDLSCMIEQGRLASIKKNYFDTKDPIIDRIMYGSDFFLNMLNKIRFNDYYKHFKNVFSDEQIKHMSVDVPKKFLGL